ncbi:pentatricopeptide repeat protein [Aspergillus flavus]|nr:pentatricopeptide repeat protein [Aspergillus flavus]
MDNRPASEYAQSGSHFPYPPSVAPHSELPAADQASAAATAQYTPQPEVRPNPQYTPQPEVRPAANISSSNTPQSDYGLNQPPPAARSPAYPDYLARPPQYHHAPNTQAGGAAGMAQATSPSMHTLHDGLQNDHRNHTNVKSDADVPIDPSIAASSPTYPPPYSPYQPQGHEMAQYQGHPPPPPPQMYARPDWSHGYGQHQHGLPGPYTTPATTVGPASPAATAGPRPGQVYSFVPIPGAQQHKRPRRRYEEIERMYKCGWNGCEKAYGTLNHLNAHVTMQSHGAKRTPEEFKEIRKEWKARKKEEEAQRKAAEERERAAAAQAAQANQVDAPGPGDPAQAGQPPAYPGSVRPQLPPIGYQPADGQVPGQYGAPGGGMVYQGNGQMAYPPNYPHSPYGQSGQVYQQQSVDVSEELDDSEPLVASEGLEDTLLEPEPSLKSRQGITRDDLLLSIAKAGTSPKTREELDGTMPVKVSGKVVEMELKWLKDPRALSDRVGRLLKADDVLLAVALVRTAQREHMECTVAWNHLMEYCMEKNNPKAALKFYNEMKKRGRMPNSVTYTIMLDGLSRVSRDTGVHPVKTALSIYKSIFAPNSTVTPNLIHTNAMLNVCARQRDMDSLWRVAGELPEDGPGSPNCTTYSIILRAISDAAQADVVRMRHSQVEKILARKAQGVKEGKRIWSDIIYRWKKGQLEIDNLLVSAMANLLMEASTDRGCYDVFALIHQVTGIPILAKEPSDPSSKIQKKSRGIDLEEDVPFVDDSEKLYRPVEAEPEEVEQDGEEETFENVFDPIVSPGTSSPSYISVGNRELSLILEACLSMTQEFGIGAGKAYWQHLTLEDTDYKIEPDGGTYHQYLRLLRLGHSSRLALDVIRNQMVPAQMTEGRSFRIAFACCLRDRKNINVFKNANGLLHLMETSLVLPFPQALGAYLDLVRILGDRPQLLMSLSGIDGNGKRPAGGLSALGQQLRLNLQTTALEALRPCIAKLDKAMEQGLVSPVPVEGRGIRSNSSNEHAVSGKEALKVLATVRGLIDDILMPANSKLLSKETRAQLKKESRDLRRYSNAKITNKYKDSLVSPTSEQVLAYKDQQVAEGSLDVD